MKTGIEDVWVTHGNQRLRCGYTTGGNGMGGWLFENIAGEPAALFSEESAEDPTGFKAMICPDSNTRGVSSSPIRSSGPMRSTRRSGTIWSSSDAS